MLRCPRCGEFSPRSARACIRCGLAFVGVPPVTLAERLRGMDQLTIILVSLLALLAVCGVATYLTRQQLPDDFSTPGSHSRAERGAFLICQDFVKRELAASSELEFAGLAVSTIHPLGSGRYRVLSYVDRGAARTSFDCTVKDMAGDKWQLENLNMN